MPSHPPATHPISGSEALAYGALEAGVRLVTGYPGSPSTATFDAIQQLVDKNTLVRWAINEKSAADAALGVSIAGERALLCVKAPGLNVALDCLMVANLAPGDGGFVILAGDDPSGWSSQNEEDSRPLVLGLEIPMLEPTSVPAAREVMRQAFELSEAGQVPVVVRITRALTLDRAALPPLQASQPNAQLKGFTRQPDRFTVLPIHVVSCTKTCTPRWLQCRSAVRAFTPKPRGRQRADRASSPPGMLTRSSKRCSTRAAAPPLRVLGLSTLNPLPVERVAAFLEGLDSVLVIEELAPVIETGVQALAQRRGLTLPVYGRASGYLPGAGELFEDALVKALERVLPDWNWPEYQTVERSMPSRKSLCDGCPYIPAFENLLAVLKRHGGRESYIITGETGCLVRGQLPPWEILDIKYSMGSSIGIATGLAYAGVSQKRIALSGDSAFLHSGIGELIDAVQAGENLLIVLLDNDKTALTGGQPHPGTRNGRAEDNNKPVDLVEVVRAAGVQSVRTIDPDDAQSTQAAFEDGLLEKGVSVVIVQKPCPVYAG